MDDRCSICREELEPGSFPQLQFDGTWVCQSCCSIPELRSSSSSSEPREYDRGR